MRNIRVDPYSLLRVAGASSCRCKATQEVPKGKISDILLWTESVTWFNNFDPAESKVDDSHSGAASEGGGGEMEVCRCSSFTWRIRELLWLAEGRWRRWVANRFAERKVMSCAPPPLPLPLFYGEQLDRSAVIGCTSSTWAAFPFLAVPNGAANSMLLAGWQTGRWEPANGRLDETQAPVNCAMGSPPLLLLRPASCHLRFGLINPLGAENHLCPSLFNYSFISSPL